MITQGGAYVNGEKVTSLDRALTRADLQDGRLVALRRGKRHAALIEVLESPDGLPAARRRIWCCCGYRTRRGIVADLTRAEKAGSEGTVRGRRSLPGLRRTPQTGLPSRQTAGVAPHRSRGRSAH